MTKKVSMDITIIGDNAVDLETLHFTNLDMETVKKVIDLLNGDTNLSETEKVRMRYSANYGKPVRTEDFNHSELFPYRFDGGEACNECGAWIPADMQDKHVTWHNKLLP